MSDRVVLDGATVPFDTNDQRIMYFDWNDNLADGVAIATSAIQVIGVSPAGLAITSITRSSTTATVTTTAAHGLSTGASVTVAGADQADYNIQATITVTGATTFTYTVANSPTTPATATTGSLTYSQGLGIDNRSIGATDLVLDDDATIYADRYAKVRLLAAGPSYHGRTYEVANKITTDETPAQTKERSFYVSLENL